MHGEGGGSDLVAPRKAWHILRGESPCRVRASYPPVSSLASIAEHLSANKKKWAKRRQSILQAVGVIAYPEVLVQLRDDLTSGCRGVQGLPKATQEHP